MSTEAPPQGPVTEPNFSPQDTASRFTEVFKNLPGNEPEAIIDTTKPEPEVKAPAQKGDIPDELLGIEPSKPAENQDEWDQLHNEEVKGQVKNENFKRYKDATGKKVSALQAELDKIKKEAEELKGRYSDDYVPEKVSKELELERKLRMEREEELGRIAVERSPMFKERFTAKQEGLFKQLQKTADELSLDKDTASQLIHSSGAKRFALLDEMDINAAAKGYISSLLQQHDQVESDKESFLSNWQEQQAKHESETALQKNAEKAKLKEYEDKVFNSTLDTMSKTFAPLRKIEGNEDWNKGVDEAIAQARNFHDGNFTTEEFDEVVLAGVGAKRLYGMYEKVVGMYRAEKARADSLQSASPGISPVDGKTPTEHEGNSERFDRADAHRAYRAIANAPRLNEV